MSVQNEINSKPDLKITLTSRYGVEVLDKNGSRDTSNEDSVTVETIIEMMRSFVAMMGEFEKFKAKHSLPGNTIVYIRANGTLGNENFDFEFNSFDDCKKLLQNIVDKSSGKVPATFNIAEGVKNNPAARKNALTHIDLEAPNKINLAHAKLMELTNRYLAKSDLDPAKKVIFENLKTALEVQDQSKQQSISKFTDVLNKADKNIINQHRTADWKRFVLNVFSILTILPALARACHSYSQYGTMSFWKASSAQAFDGIGNALESVEKLKV